MAERIELPQKGGGTAEEQLEAMYRYLYQMAVALNNNLAEIGGPALTDDEAQIMQRILQGTEEDQQTGGPREAETLKSMIIKTASFIKTAIDEYNLRLIGSVEAEGKLGRYVRKTGLDVDVNPEGIEQRFTFEEVVQGLKTYEINAKNYIKTGLLRTVGGLPVYGVAVGKDIVTFSEDGTETYHDGNKVAEYLADGITFWQNGAMIAKYTGSRISFYYGSSEVFYIQAGKIYCTNDLELSSGKKLIINTENFKIDSTGKVTIKGGGEFSGDLVAAGGTFAGDLSAAGGTFSGNLQAAGGTFAGDLSAAGGTFSGNLQAAGGSFKGSLTAATGTFAGDLSAAGGTFAGDLSAAGGSFGGTLSAADGTFYGELVAASGTFTGDLSAAGGTFKGDLQAAGGTFAGDLSAAGGTFAGDLSAAGGTFSGDLSAAGGTFAGTMSAACVTSGTMKAERISGGTLTLGGNNNGNGVLIVKDANGSQIGKWDKDGITATKGTFSGDLSAAGGTFAGDLSAAGGSFKGSLTAATGTFAGNLSAAGGSFKGSLSAATGTFAGNLSAAGGSFKGSLTAATGTFAGDLSAAGGTFAGTMSAACVTSGTMLADRISGGSLIMGGQDNGNGVVIIRNASGIEIGRWDKDGLIATSGTFGGKLNAASGSFHGDLVSNGQIVDITATGFVLNSQLELMKLGDWKFYNRGLIYEGDTGNMALGKYGVNSTSDSKPLTSIMMNEPNAELGQFYFMHQNASKNIVGRIVFSAGKLGSSEFNTIRAESPQTYQGQTVMLPTKGTLGVDAGRWDVYGDKVYYNQMIQGSSRKIKRDIRDMENQGERIDRLRPVTFKYKDDPQGQTRQGLILEETREIMPEICSEDGISYMDLVPILLKEVQELRARVSRLEMIAREA